jgi:hypothetical protein
MHPVEVPFEGIEMRGPEPSERSEPGVHFLEPLGPEPVEPALCVHGGLHESGVAQHPQVLRHGRLRETELALDLSDRQLGRDQQPQHRAPRRLGDDLEGGSHELYIRHSVYACQGIYSKGKSGSEPGRQDRIGSIAVGKNADLVVTKGDPAARIADIENVELVFKDGVGYDTKKLLDSVKGRYGEY